LQLQQQQQQRNCNNNSEYDRLFIKCNLIKGFNKGIIGKHAINQNNNKSMNTIDHNLEIKQYALSTNKDHNSSLIYEEQGGFFNITSNADVSKKFSIKTGNKFTKCKILIFFQNIF
jgi:hypothetical protein